MWLHHVHSTAAQRFRTPCSHLLLQSSSRAARQKTRLLDVCLIGPSWRRPALQRALACHYARFNRASLSFGFRCLLDSTCVVAVCKHAGYASSSALPSSACATSKINIMCMKRASLPSYWALAGLGFVCIDLCIHQLRRPVFSPPRGNRTAYTCTRLHETWFFGFCAICPS